MGDSGQILARQRDAPSPQATVQLACLQANGRVLANDDAAGGRDENDDATGGEDENGGSFIQPLEHYPTRTFTTTKRTETTKNDNKYLIELRNTFQDLRLDIGIPVSVHVNFSDTDSNSEEITPRITVGGMVLHEHLRRLYHSLPASYHEFDDFHLEIQLTKAEVFHRMAKWSEPDMVRGIRINRNLKHPKSKIIQLALAKRGDWDKATYGYGMERYMQRFGRNGKDAIAEFYLKYGATTEVLEGGVVVRLTNSPSFLHRAASARDLLPVLNGVHEVAFFLILLYGPAKIIFLGEI
ncbi:hypothetical protein V8F33_002325 [Rhypophila sp. PSN 637]